MSIPLNPLSQFTSYNYRHILSVCNTTKVAEYLARPDSYTDIISQQSTRDVVTITNGGPTSADVAVEGYVTVINGFSDSDLIITSLQSTNVIAPSTIGNAPPSTLAVSGSMTIIEPYGARFLEILQDAFDGLHSDPNGLTFVLKTLFIGHTDGGSPDYSINVKPIMFIPVDIRSNFTSAGAEHVVDFVSVVNGAASLPFVSAGGTMSFESNGNKLTDALKACEVKLNTRSAEDFKKLGDAYGKSGRMMKYRITYDSVYDGEAYLLDNPKTLNQNTPGVVQFSFGKAPSIEQMVDKIMRSCQGVEADASDGTISSGAVQDRDRYTFKIHSAAEYTMDECTIHYHITRQRLVYGKPSEIFSGTGPSDAAKESALEFDYFFSGKNIDILDFNIKMDMGLAFFQTLGAADNIPDARQATSDSDLTTKGPTSTGALAKPSQGVRRLNVLTPADYSKKHHIKNTNNSKQTTEFQAMLSRWASVEMIEAKMTIVGNPVLLSDITYTPSDITSGQFDQPINNNAGDRVFPFASNTPSLVKVNIFMPDPENPHGGDITPFWYRGYYFVYEVENDFSEGAFTQTLSLMALPLDGLI